MTEKLGTMLVFEKEKLFLESGMSKGSEFVSRMYHIYYIEHKHFGMKNLDIWLTVF